MCSIHYTIYDKHDIDIDTGISWHHLWYIDVCDLIYQHIRVGWGIFPFSWTTQAIYAAGSTYMSPTVMLISMEWFKACTRGTCFVAAVDKLFGGEGVEIDVWMEKTKSNFYCSPLPWRNGVITNISSKFRFVRFIVFGILPGIEVWYGSSHCSTPGVTCWYFVMIQVSVNREVNGYLDVFAWCFIVEHWMDVF